MDYECKLYKMKYSRIVAELGRFNMGEFKKNEDFSFSENILNIKWYERKVNILKQAQW